MDINGNHQAHVGGGEWEEGGVAGGVWAEVKMWSMLVHRWIPSTIV